MVTAKLGIQAGISCPKCHAEVYYRYGHTLSGKQRFICLICGRQFIPGVSRAIMKDKPLCPVCGRIMHQYKRGGSFIRYRCSCYPFCRTFVRKNDVANPFKEDI